MSTSIEKLYNLFQKYPLVCTDSRNVKKDSIFFALRGGNFDGNEFSKDALEKGAAFAVIDNSKFKKDDRCILVNDSLKTLQVLAQYHRSRFDIPVIGITGSNGKTTTKDLIENVLSKKYNVVATKENQNNHIGVPLTLFSINPKTEIAVIEMGTNYPGEIAFLSSLASPTHGIITNIGKAHLEGLKDESGVLKEKRILFDEIKSRKGTVFINEGDKHIASFCAKLNPDGISYNPDESKILESFPYLKLKYKNVTLTTKFFGKFNAANIIAAFEIGKYFDVPLGKIKKGLEEYTPKDNRSQVIKTDSGYAVFDAYNANPTSMEHALESFLELQDDIPKSVILADMQEVGDNTLEEHINILKKLNGSGINSIILTGPLFAKAYDQADLKDEKIMCFEDSDKLCEYLSQNKKSLHGHLLVKGSRKAKLEKILPFLS